MFDELKRVVKTRL